MTAEEIKSRYNMRDVAARYGLIPNRSGFIRCPFHKGDRTASCKLYERDFHCFGCGANGDIFSFVMKMEHCDFKTAFYSLGGEYEKQTFSSKLAVYRSKIKQKERKREEERLKERLKWNLALITIFRNWVNHAEPLSAVWCDCYNRLQYQFCVNEQIADEMNGREA